MGILGKNLVSLADPRHEFGDLKRCPGSPEKDLARQKRKGPGSPEADLGSCVDVSAGQKRTWLARKGFGLVCGCLDSPEKESGPPAEEFGSPETYVVVLWGCLGSPEKTLACHNGL